MQRLADEYDAAQERGEVAVQGKPSKTEGLAKTADIGLTRKQIHEASQSCEAIQQIILGNILMGELVTHVLQDREPAQKTYGLWNPKREGHRNGREAVQQLRIAPGSEALGELSAKVKKGLVEAGKMIRSQNVCEQQIGEYHLAFYAELETWLARDGAR